MSYLGAVNIIKNISEAINPTGIFSHSDKWKASLNFGEANKQIYLYPITAGVDLTNHYYESWNMVMGFYFQDAPDSTALDQQGLVAQADDMVTEFLAVLNETEGVELSNSKKEPSYRQMSGTYTGYLLSFTLGYTTDLCDAGIIYPEIPNYPSLRPYSVLWDISEGANTITHNIGKEAKFVTFLKDGQEIYFDWVNVSDNVITVNAVSAVSQVQINIISYEV